MEYLIRDCQLNDLDSLIKLCAKHADFEKATFQAKEKKERLSNALFKKDAPLKCWIVEMGGEAVGYVTYTFDYSTWDAAYFLYLDCLYLNENCRGFGVGEEIIKKLVGEAKRNNCANMQWQTPSFNERAIKFYHRVGGVSKEKKRFTLSLF
jgi:GNAT superfamily N-acetyltransferase